MKLKDLIKKVPIQGDIRISMWDDMGENEFFVRNFFSVDRIFISDVKDIQNKEILYMFCGPDGMLHIELDSNS